VNSGEATQKSSSMLTLSIGKCNAKMQRPGTKCAGKENVTEKNSGIFCEFSTAWHAPTN
jgi:hypothetical protein